MSSIFNNVYKWYMHGEYSFSASNTEIYSKINLQNTSVLKMKFDYSYKLENFKSCLKIK